jgi:hypothetical protein
MKIKIIQNIKNIKSKRVALIILVLPSSIALAKNYDFNAAKSVLGAYVETNLRSA